MRHNNERTSANESRSKTQNKSITSDVERERPSMVDKPRELVEKGGNGRTSDQHEEESKVGELTLISLLWIWALCAWFNFSRVMTVSF